MSSTLFQILIFFNQIADCGVQSPDISDLFLCHNTIVCSTVSFPLLCNCDHLVSVSIEFPSNSTRDAPFHCIAFNCFCADQDGFCDLFHDPQRYSMGGYLGNEFHN